MVLYGSNLGDANIHDNTNLLILLAGGGLQHGQHMAFSRENNKPLCNLFVTRLQNIGVEFAKGCCRYSQTARPCRLFKMFCTAIPGGGKP